MNYVINNEYYTVTVSDLGAEMISLKGKDGRELLWQATDERFWEKHSPLLFPVCGRLKDSKYTWGGVSYDMSAHGFIGRCIFTVKEISDDSITLVSCADENTRTVYPFDYSLTAKYTLCADTIRSEFEISNKGECEMPYMFGLHPGFALHTDGGADIEDYSLKLGRTSVSWIPLQNVVFARPYGEPFELPRGEYVLNEEQIYANDTMIFTDVPTRVKLSSKKNAYSLDMSWSDNFPYLCIWKNPDNAAKFICLEPWSDVPADGVTPECFETRRMHRLPASSTEKYSYELKFTY